MSLKKNSVSILITLNTKLSNEYPDYKFDFDRYKLNATLIQELLPIYR